MIVLHLVEVLTSLCSYDQIRLAKTDLRASSVSSLVSQVEVGGPRGQLSGEWQSID